MSRSTRALIVYMALLVSILLAIPVAAHPVSVSDTSRVDWFGKGRAVANIGIISRNTTGAGEFVWTDAKSDQRIVSTDGATGNILSEIDLVKFNVTADTANLYLLAKMDSITNVTNNPSPELMIAIDSDLNHTGGETALPDGIATNVAATAQWEYVVQTQFTNVSATARPKVFTPTASGICLTCAAQLVSKDVQQGSFIELQIPWDQIGGLPASENFLRFTVLTHYSDKRAPSDGSSSKAIDVLSTTDTSDELSGDNTINTHFDLHFTSSGEVFAPLLISEFLPDPPGSDTEGEWIEIVNPNSFPVSLQGYKVGDQVYRSGNQGMLQLPNRLLPAGAALVIARNQALFQTRYPSVPAGSIVDMQSLPAYTKWATGTLSLQNTLGGRPFKESIGLLDPRDTIIDMIQYTTPVLADLLNPDNQPLILTGTSVVPNASYDRCPATIDTNNGQFDFVIHPSVAAQTPGQLCQGVPGVDLRIAKEGPESVVPGEIISYTIPFYNAGTGPAAAANVVITDTLPAGLTCAAQSASPGVVFASTCPGGTMLSWTIASLPPGASGVISLTATVNPSVEQNASLVNSAGITSNPAESATTLRNNIATHTAVTAGPPNLVISSTWATGTGTSPGAEFTYTIAYVNAGTDDAQDIVITDTLPANVTLIRENAAGATFNNATSGNLVWRLSSLVYQEAGTITVVVKISDRVRPNTSLKNTITISSNPPDIPQGNVETATLTVGQAKLYLPIIRK